ncbi:MAG: Energy-dependent translational throttle protein EttA [uncultured Sphingomonadaceae bacterium]|uniref:Energy-dependent translational throttle protein EttA n=1 Tax=uncultured Sphingomonadaceae bacterium TaxID=169976 RepID=A0A6J4T949_9SPHN|nr:MAG: Energy-dependent translational throttle protein EttA [uncultured Sphingomonadaceae bacterium]
MRRSPKARQTKSKARIRAFDELVEAQENRTPGKAQILIQVPERLGGTVIEAKGLTKAYGDRVLFAPFSGEISRTERIAILGPNGCGKSTLMRVLAGVAQPARGSVVLGTGVRTAYYRQDFTHLNPDHKIRDEVALVAPRITTQELRSHLGRFLFSGDDAESRVGDLSGGEQARVALAKITLEKANLLLLDEPTNHLDLESREALEEALEGFDGTVVLISHDRAFLAATATRVWGFNGDRVEDFAGGFDEWVEHTKRRAEAAPAVSRASSTPSAAPVRAATGLSKNEQRRREREMERLEADIAALETRIAELESALADPALYASGTTPERARQLTADLTTAQSSLAAAYESWERMGEELAGV